MMNKSKEKHESRFGFLLASLAFLVSFGFFLTLYPSHLLRREQLNLFVYDWDYIAMKFNGMGWLSRLSGSFFEQFFFFRVFGALVVAMLLTTIGVVTCRICRKFLGGRMSVAIASIVFIWSFLRECGNFYLTRYTIATLGLLSLILLALQFKTVWSRILAAVPLLCFGAWAFGAPFNSTYGRLWGMPQLSSERLFEMDMAVSRENWDRVLELSEKKMYSVEASNCFNLAMAMKGQLGNGLFDYPQSDDVYHFLPFITGDENVFYNSLAGELWYQLGDMTIAEQGAITCLQASPEHTGARFIERLARVNMISGQNATAQKYLNILSKTLHYGKWARRMLDGTLTEEEGHWIERARANMVSSDTIHVASNPRTVLLTLLEANPENTAAREYLLCHDLLRYDLEQFCDDYAVSKLDGHIYTEAYMIWLGQNNVSSQQAVDEYGIDDSYAKRMDTFFRYPENYRNTYWYYYLKALNEQDRR